MQLPGEHRCHDIDVIPIVETLESGEIWGQSLWRPFTMLQNTLVFHRRR